MAITSTQYTGQTATPRRKSNPRDQGNNFKIFYAESPDTYTAQAIAERFDFGVIPKGSRIVPTGVVQCAAGAASSTLDIGIRSLATGTVIDIDGLAKVVNLTTAGVKPVNTGDLFLTGNGYVTTEDVIVYGTFQGATNTANQKISLTLQYVTGD